MTFHEQLARATAADRDYLLAAPAIRRCLAGEVTRELYVAFLTQAYHHVRHTVPLLMAVGARLPDRHRWLQRAVLHYLEEETGHEEWILNDIEHAGGDRAAAAASEPAIATEAMVAYAYDTVMRRNPLGFFGMVHVLEGTSVALALNAADRIQQTLGLPSRAFTYLRSHGELDKEHVNDLAAILARFTDAEDRAVRPGLPRPRRRGRRRDGGARAQENGVNPAAIKALVTGGGGGIGGAIADELLTRGASALLVDRDSAALERAAARLAIYGERVRTLTADLTSVADRQRLCAAAADWRGGVNVLINNAGVNHFRMFADQPPEQLDLAIAINLLAPIHLCQDLLPHLQRQPEACILNTGSVFGAIGYPGYAVYSATKFAVRGFTEALRRELADTNVTVRYLAPRATRTGINTAAVERMNDELGVTMDPPELVAKAVCDMLAGRRVEAVIGWPEKFFARMNGVLPRLVDGALRKQLPVIRRYAGETPAVAVKP